jgi:iron(III) transport system ATP-binding protein
VFQSYALFPHMSVNENVGFGLKMRNRPRDEIEKAVREALRLVRLDNVGERLPKQLSGGQQQRVALARTLAVRPRVLLLDEPLSNLDAKMRVQVRRELRDLQRSLGITAIFVTHDQEEANTVCDRIAVMNNGVVQQVAAPMDLFADPANLFVANFLGAINLLPGAVEGGGYRLADDRVVTLSRPAEAGAQMMVRPQDIAILADQTVPAGRLPLAGEVRDREFLGSIMRYVVQTPLGDLKVDNILIGSAPVREIGDAVTLAIDPARALYLQG